MADETQNRRGVKSKLPVVGLLTESISDDDDDYVSEEYDDDNVLMELADASTCSVETRNCTGQVYLIYLYMY